MKKAIFLIMAVFFNQVSFAQNLVPNPSFENYILCPQTAGEIWKCQSWKTFGHSPDYYNSCNIGVTGVPINNPGYQLAYNGQAYAGFHNYYSPQPFREFIGTQLTQQFSINQKYYISFRVSLADNTPFNCASSNIGIKFSSILYDSLNLPLLNNTAHIFSSSIITDSIGWYEIKGSFIADSNYSYLIIGNFYDDAHTTNNCTISSFASYYYVDDVCVSVDSNDCYFQTGLPIIINKNIQLTFENNKIILTPFFYMKEEAEIKIYNLLGKILFNEKKMLSNTIEINIRDLSNSIYLLSIESKKINQIFKFIKK